MDFESIGSAIREFGDNFVPTSEIDEIIHEHLVVVDGEETFSIDGEKYFHVQPGHPKFKSNHEELFLVARNRFPHLFPSQSGGARICQLVYEK